MACDKGNKTELENQAFISIIKEYPIILDKSNLPSNKNKRNRAIEEIQHRIENESGFHLDSSQILKKFNNMKSRVKSKADTKKTGNKKIILKPWEEELIKFIEGDTDNPAIVRLKGAVSAGTEKPQNENISDSSVDSTKFEIDCDKTTENPQGSNVKKAKKKLKLTETEETKDLTLPELQRLVLLKQLEYFKKAEKLVDIQLRREESKQQSVAASEQSGMSTEELQTSGTSYSTTCCDGFEFTDL